jgi:hypothetical protein
VVVLGVAAALSPFTVEHAESDTMAAAARHGMIFFFIWINAVSIVALQVTMPSSFR